MKHYSAAKAFFDAQKLVDEVLIQAGLIDGIALDRSEVKDETDPMFWFIRVPSKEASEKQTYVTYSVNEVTRYASSDGLVTARQVTVNINIFTRKRNSRELIESINEAFENERWNFDLSFSDYDPSTQLYQYGFTATAVINDE